MRLYAAYGSNINANQMAFRCPDAKIVGKTWLEGYRLVFQGNPGNAHANVIPDAENRTPLLLWTISESDEAMLDRYEGVRGGYYTKETVSVEVNGEQRDALIYMMTPNPYNMPSTRYLNGIRAGYKEFMMPTVVLTEALWYSRQKIEEGA